MNPKKIILPQENASLNLTSSHFCNRVRIPEKWFRIISLTEFPQDVRTKMLEIVNRCINFQVVMKDNDTEMQVLIDLVINHARFDRLERLRTGDYVPLSIVEDNGNQYQYIIGSRGKKHLFCLRNVRIMLKGNPEAYVGRLSEQFDPKLFEKSKDLKQLLWEVGVIFRKGDGKGKNKREPFYGPDKDDKRIMLPYYWDYRKTMDRIVMVGLFPNRKVRIIAEQPQERFSAYAFSLFGDIPIRQAKTIITKVNMTMNLFRNTKPRFPEIIFDRERSLLVVTNNCLAYGIRVRKVGCVEVEQMRVKRISRRWENFTKIINYSREEGIRRSREKTCSPAFYDSPNQNTIGGPDALL